MISKARIREIRALERKKVRDREGLFVAEGPKLVGELLAAQGVQGGLSLRYLAAMEAWLRENASKTGGAEVDVVSAEELARASLLQHPQDVIALFSIPRTEVSLCEVAERELVLALDGVQDPGNLGTIVRLADWFGIRHVFCSADCADVFNPKATQATMGALARVGVHNVDLVGALQKTKAPVFGTFLDGDNIYGEPLSANGVVVMGNEGRGISSQVETLVNRRLFIPPFPEHRQTVESLNVAIATAIVCAEFRRRR